MILEHSAGGIIYKKEKSTIMIVMIMDPYGKWTFPKGHIEKDEKPEEAALRESSEETGLTNLEFVKQVGKTDFWFKDRWEGKNDLIHKTVDYYLFKAKDNFNLTPQTKEINDAKWVSLEKASKLSNYKDNTIIIKNIIKILE
jgi:8-oxo-dGTP diphosphatase